MTRQTSAEKRVEWLRFYCARGMRLLPVYEITDGGCACHQADCEPRNWGKHPRIGAWPQNATADESQVRQWNLVWPGCNWAWALDDHVVLDDDPRNGGFEPDEFFSQAEERLGLELPPTLTALTGGGGLHVVYRTPEGLELRNGKLYGEDGRAIRGIDVKGSGGYVLVEPSNHHAGGDYRWSRWTDPVELPADVLPWLTRRGGPGTGGAILGTGGSEEDQNVRFSLDDWLAGAGDAVEGEQREYLLRGLGWMRECRYPRGVMIVLGWQVAASFTCFNEVDPWTEAHVIELVEDVNRRYVPGMNRNQVIPTWTPAVSGTGTGGGGEPPEIQDGDGVGGVGGVGGGDPLDDRLTAVRMKDILVERNQHELVWTDAGGWYAWRGVRWEHDPHEAMRRYEGLLLEARRDLTLQHELGTLDGEQFAVAIKRLDGWETHGHIAGTVELARKDMCLDLEAFNLDPYLLNCPNGVLDLRTGKLLGHAAEHRITRIAGVGYDPEARSDLLEEFHETFMPDPEHRDALYRLLGSCLVGGNPHRLLPVIMGPTSTGKSQFVETIRRALGGYAGVGGPNALRGKLDDAPRPDLLALMPTRLAIFEEAGHAWELHVDQVKRITGATALAARGMHSNTFLTRVPDFTPLIVANVCPRIKDADEAVRRRLIVIPFETRPGVDDPVKAEVFKEDRGVWAALLRELMDGLLRFSSSGGIAGADALPVAFVEATMRAFEDMDDVSEFIRYALDDGVIIFDSDAQQNQCIRRSELHLIYKRWIKEHGDQTSRRDQLGSTSFNRRLMTMGWERGRSGFQVWRGVRSGPNSTWTPWSERGL